MFYNDNYVEKYVGNEVCCAKIVDGAQQDLLEVFVFVLHLREEFYFRLLNFLCIFVCVLELSDAIV